mmetsp:Transcript_13826/g.21368  ORF Transcript_13826/g.21368 Transcript_13826/m.21368 type:complete len:100 (+) Transcript_13826:48-347(+)
MTPSSSSNPGVNYSSDHHQQQRSIRDMSRILRRIKRRMFLQAVQNGSPTPANKQQQLRSMLQQQPDDDSSSSRRPEIHSSPSFQSSCSSIQSIKEEYYE